MMRAEAYAPGRVELLGNHTDYNEGVVLGAAIDRGLTVIGETRDDDLISISSTMMGSVEIPRAQLGQQKAGHWANYALGVAAALRALNVPIVSFSVRVDGNLPGGCGLSSSAAFEVATALFLLKLSNHKMPRLEIAKVCQRAEHQFVGVQSGLLDQVCSIFGRANQAVFFDARSEEVRTIQFPKRAALVIANSGCRRELINGLYNERHKETRAAAERRALRDVSADALAKSKLPPRLRRRAAHIVGENERVWRGLDLLAADDGPGFGALMNESHESSRMNFENSTPELDLLVDIARQLPAVWGARLTGGGFGGATASLCEEEQAEQVAKELARQYTRRTKIQSQTFVCRIAEGAR
jgi:galactokinase